MVIVDWLIKMVYYEPIKVTINALGLAEVIINVVMHHDGLRNSIVSDCGSVITSRF